MFGPLVGSASSNFQVKQSAIPEAQSPRGASLTWITLDCHGCTRNFYVASVGVSLTAARARFLSMAPLWISVNANPCARFLTPSGAHILDQTAVTGHAGGLPVVVAFG